MPDIMRQKSALRIVGDKTEAVRNNRKNERFIVTPFEDAEFREACNHLLDTCPPNTEVLNERHLKKKLREMSDVITYVERVFNPKYEYCLSIFPTSDLGNPLSPSSIENHHYLHLFAANRETHQTSGFSFDEGKYIDLLPNHIRQNCRLVIPEAWAGNFQQKRQQFGILVHSYINAYNSLREFLDLKPFTPEETGRNSLVM